MRKIIGSAFVVVALMLTAGPSVSPSALAQTKPKDTQKDKSKPGKATSTLTVEIYKDAGGDFRFRIKDGDTLLASSGKGYDSKDDIMKVVNELKTGMAAAKIVDDSSDAPKDKGKPKKDKDK